MTIEHRLYVYRMHCRTERVLPTWKPKEPKMMDAMPAFRICKKVELLRGQIAQSATWAFSCGGPGFDPDPEQV